MSSSPSVSLFPEQTQALASLIRGTNAVAVDVAPADFHSLRVVTFHHDDQRDDEAPPCTARWWTVSIAGTVREQAPDFESVTA